MILDFYFVVGSHFRFPGLVFCSEFGATLLDGFVFCRPLFSTKSPVSTLTPNEQGDYIYNIYIIYWIACMLSFVPAPFVQLAKLAKAFGPRVGRRLGQWLQTSRSHSIKRDSCGQCTGKGRERNHHSTKKHGQCI